MQIVYIVEKRIDTYRFDMSVEDVVTLRLGVFKRKGDALEAVRKDVEVTQLNNPESYIEVHDKHEYCVMDQTDGVPSKYTEWAVIDVDLV